MARYTISILDKNPWATWPDLLAYDGATRARWDAAMLLFQRAVYEAVEGEALLDRPAGRDAILLARRIAHSPAIRRGYCVSVDAVGYRVTVTRYE